MSYQLKIKSKHLSEESRIIRAEEFKAARIAKKLRKKQSELNGVNHEHPGVNNNFRKVHDLAHHRSTVVRYEARATYLARAYLRGHTYEHVEKEGRKVEGDTIFRKIILPKVHYMVNRYGNGPWVSMSQIEVWAGLSEVSYD